ncbi:hypothetical protein [Engelhardtia mirabilis]|uniref:Uncharacterized protein n=1 Tax=Engelhardtia mirabilis TaxID=2528011 RepID=A0A518BHF9_9BACT|nr:hypothetical protein Pla133_14920 [Planctomycetes bacterium Pla133]QDV00746.1 hypothetical protein Pla86_14910 [Planctomycetes bacterium Pla86]
MSEPVDLARVRRTWWPLAASWMLMGVELPLVSAHMARLAEPEVSLAAYGALVFPICLVIEAPIIMLLAASTALCTTRARYAQVARFMHAAGAALTALHLLVALTPLYDLIARDLIGVPPEILEPGRLGLLLMTPWTWTIAYRRFQQGVMIRFGASRAVGVGTVVRVVTLVTALQVGMRVPGAVGIAVGATAVALAVSAEAIFAGWAVGEIRRERLPKSDGEALLTLRGFLGFYVPLAMTPLLTLLIQPIGAAAMSRMPRDLESLAVWPALHGLVFLFRSPGFALNEVVVALVREPGGQAALVRFTRILGCTLVGGLALLALTPLHSLWFAGLTGLSPELAQLAGSVLILAVLMPGYQAFQSLYQGILVARGDTRPVTEAVALYLVLAAGLLAAGVHLDPGPGVAVALGCFTLAGLAQTLWLARRSRRYRV